MLCLVLLLGGVSESLRAEPVGDSLTLFQREMLRASPAEQRPAAGFMNPAAEAFRQSFSLSELAVGYADSRRGEAALAQEGTGANGFPNKLPKYPKGNSNGYIQNLYNFQPAAPFGGKKKGSAGTLCQRSARTGTRRNC